MLSPLLLAASSSQCQTHTGHDNTACNSPCPMRGARLPGALQRPCDVLQPVANSRRRGRVHSQHLRRLPIRIGIAHQGVADD
eukprot:1629210-Rhodomonas_salina.1